MHCSCWIRFEPRELLDALATQQKSLRSIKLELTEVMLDFHGADYTIAVQIFGNFRDFIALQTLDFPYSMLVGEVPELMLYGEDPEAMQATAKRMASSLPRTLRNFTINNCWGQWEMESATIAMTKLIELKEQDFPDLSVLGLVVGRQDAAATNGQSFHDLFARARSQGVEFEVWISDFMGRHRYDY